MMFEFAEEIDKLTDIRVAGVGGAGGNAIGRMIEAGLVGVEFMALNTDLQALNDCKAHHCMQIGSVLTQGLGSGGNPAVGQGAAEEDREQIDKIIGGANMVFVTAGMGGGTGTGAAPIVAEVAREKGALTVGIVTKPFLFEGQVRLRQAEEGIEKLREAVDTLIVVPNQRLLEIVPPNTSMVEAYRIADNVLYEATRGIFEIISRHDHMNLDFADVCSVMRGMGEAMMGTGRAEGENRAMDAAQMAISSPLLDDVNIHGSQAVLVNVLGREVQLHETAAAMQFIQDAAGPQAHVIFGYGTDESLGDSLQVTVIATGFQADQPKIEAAIAPAQAEAEPVEPVVEMEPVAEMETEQDIDSEMEVEEEPQLEPVHEEIADPAEDEPLDFVPEPDPWLSENNVMADPVSDEAAPMAGIMDEERSEPAPSTIDLPEELIEEKVAEAVLEEPAPLESAPAELETQENEAEGRPFLAREAASGGADVVSEEPPVASPFLRPVGTKSIGEVEVPEDNHGPVRVNRSEASGLGPDNPGDDRKTPAYIRKYMD